MGRLMVYLFTALYCEASLFIRQFRLEKNLGNTLFQEFYRESAGIRLVITGVGEIAAAAAVSSTFTKYRPTEEDVLINIGTCASADGGDGVFLCSKIIEQATGKTFYPDILYRHHFREQSIVTGMLPCNSGEICSDGSFACGMLYDMEAAAIYQAGSFFLGPHQMLFVKVVSDSGTANEVSREQAEHVMKENWEVLSDFILQFQMMNDSRKKRGNLLQEGGDSTMQDSESLLEKLCSDMHCSKVMGDSLKSHMRYWILAGTEYSSVIQEMYQEGLLPCHDKREGKACFEELKQRLF